MATQIQMMERLFQALGDATRLRILGLLLAVVLFSSDKTTVGLLVVPPMLFVPLVLLYSLCRREKSKSPPAR